MNKMFLVVVSVFAFAVYAQDQAAGQSEKKSKRERSRELFEKRTGGLISVPGAKQGKLVIADAQSSIPREWLQALADSNASAKKIDIEVATGTFTFPEVKILGNATLYVVDDPKLPVILHAPESRWTLVNVAPLRSGRGQKPQFFEARAKKELVRGFALLAGTQTSNYPDSLLGSITSPDQLDKFADAELPVDIPERYLPYLAGFGIKPDQQVPYSTACKEGWAPKPVNENQRRIWDEVHQLPSKPIRIEPPSKGQLSDKNQMSSK